MAEPGNSAIPSTRPHREIGESAPGKLVGSPLSAQVEEIARDGTSRLVEREWVPEAPVALEFNGLSYAVMMASPADLEDFATGFALTEGLAKAPGEILDVAIAEVEEGWIVRTRLAGLGIEKLTERVRARVAESSCGLCGIESLASLAKPLAQVPPHRALEPAAIFAALSALPDHQVLTRRTRAAHAAAFCDTDGTILVAREDVGRHNAMDKLVGATRRSGRSLEAGFILSSARCSYEIVEKAVRAGATTLATISLPTTLALQRARAAGLSLWVLARHDSVLNATAPGKDSPAP